MTTTTKTTKPATTTTSTMPTATDNNNPFAGLTQEQLEKTLGVLRSEQAWFAKTDIPYMIALNGKAPNFGLWIFESDLPKVGWYGLEHEGIYKDDIE
jgi:hypothetical protein